MKNSFYDALRLSLVLIALNADVRAGCYEPSSDEEVFRKSGAVVKVEVSKRESYFGEDGLIRTRYELKLLRTYKGSVDRQFEIVSMGGDVGVKSDLRSDFLDLEEGEAYALMLDKDVEGNWRTLGMRTIHTTKDCGAMCHFLHYGARGDRPEVAVNTEPELGVGAHESNNGVPGSKVTATGYSETGGQPTRFTTCDGDEPIGYLVDIDVTRLPTGMDQAGALAAVAEVMGVWAQTTSLRFRFDGIQSFGVGASTINTQDRRLRIQLHDAFGEVNNGALGIGGGGFRSASSTFTGGILGAQGFQERLYGYVVMESTTNSATLLDASRFKRVLTHEIGHALGLEHSSEDPNEPDPILKSATMYFTSNTGGAVIGAYDLDRIQFGYPSANTPPFAVDRAISLVTTGASFGTLPTGVLGLNRFQLRAVDRQGDTMTPILVSSSSGAGTFTLSGMELVFTPTTFVNSARLTDQQIESGTSFGSAVIQFSDGVNTSRGARFSVVGVYADRTPSDGLPDDWMNANFVNTATGVLGSGRHPDDDPDKDGLTNRLEFILNTNPNDAASGPVNPVYDRARRLTFTPVRFAPYWVESSTTLENGSWGLRRVTTMYQAAQDVTLDFSTNAMPANEFYRVATGF
jgi:hypothetical protein